jgi:hypothetical protein
MLRHRPESTEEKRRLADAGLTADEHERRRDETTAEHAVELGHAGRNALGLLGDDVDEPQKRPGLAPLRPTNRNGFGDERAELPAAGAAP